MGSPITDGTTFFSLTGLGVSLFAAGMLVIVPRRYAMVPILVLVCYMTLGQRVLIGGLDFTMLRILLFFGWLRLIVRNEAHGLRFNTVDKLILAWTVIRTLNYTLVWGSFDALINRLGYDYNILGAYFLLRFLLRDPEEVYGVIRHTARFIVPLAVLMVIEKTSAQNMFAMFGGVPFESTIRDGVIRAQGPFGHAILAGTFGATAFPLFVGMWRYRRSKLALLGAISAIVVVAMAGSSGPVLALLAGVVAMCFWPLRNDMKLLWIVLAFALPVLQVAMSSPIWFIMGRLTVFSSSTGWYRGYLIDMAMRHIDEWWLIGTTTAAQWHPFLADVTNEYINEGLSGGLASLILFLAVLGVSFGMVGRAARSVRQPRNLRLLTWAFGASLFAHAVSFLSVSYFDQNFIMFYLVLAAIPACSRYSAKAPVVQPAHEGETPLPAPAYGNQPLCT